MDNDQPFYLRLYERMVFDRPLLVIVGLLIIFAGLAYNIKDFRLDASEDSLILENDQDLLFYREITRNYGTSDYLLLTFTPNEPLLAKKTLTTIAEIRDDLKELPKVKSVVSIVDIPLLRSPPVPLKEFKQNNRTLLSDDVDMELAAKELKESPIFTNMLVSPELKTTVFQINFIRNKELQQLQKRKSVLLDKKIAETMTDADRLELQEINARYVPLSDSVKAEKHKTIALLRELKLKYKDAGTFFVGGISMVADDLISFVKNDLKVFGSGMMVFLVVTLWVIFRRKRWVLLPMLCCLLSATAMMGILGIFGWEVTVISSNFISLQLIVTMSLTVHLIVRYTELLNANPDEDHKVLVRKTVRTIFKPCLYTSLTTVAGFSSLIVCDILPVVNFGWMMSMGLCLSLTLVFLLFPSALCLMSKVKASKNHQFGYPITTFFAKFTDNHGTTIFVGAAIVAVLTIIGISRLRVENSFIDYFKETTEIYQGMSVIDQELGGTTPLDVIVTIDDEPEPEPEPAMDESVNDEFAEFGEFEEEPENGHYWYTVKKMEKVRAVHEYLESQPAVGKVLSLRTLLIIAKGFTNGQELENLDLALLFKELPDSYSKILVDPFVNIDKNEVRFTLRIKDSMEDLERNALLHEIRHDLIHKVGLKEENVRLSGLMVLYNNMLQSLFASQIKTIGLTVLALFIMFLILFRSIKLSLIALFPNVLASVVVLGVMGLLDIPLDMMTITIVAISIGIAVDNTIHYIHRFKHEIRKDNDYDATMHRCHGSIGNAMYYTSITIIIGFSILALSNFIPSILFGLLTGLAMMMALVAALTLLPRLIMVIKPFKQQS